MAVKVERAMSGAMPCRLRLYVPGDEGAILALYNRIAPKPRSLAHWRWKYRQNPANPVLIAVAEDEEGTIVGHYGSIPARAHVDGRPCRIVQGVDVMVDVAYRQTLRKHGLSVRLALFFYSEVAKRRDAVGSKSPEYWWICYGFPTLSHLRLGEKFLGYTALAPVGSLAVSIQELQRRLGKSAVEDAFDVQQQRHADASVDRLWNRCVEEMPTAVIRDQAYLNWRYRDCPDQTYRILLAQSRLTGELEGLAVLCVGWQDRPAVAVADWLVPGYANGAQRALLRAALTAAEEEKCQDLVAWFPPQSSVYMDLVALGFRPIPAGYWLVGVRPHRNPLAPEAMEPSWYYTLGDSDLV